MELSQVRPQIVRNKTPEDHQGHDWRHRNLLLKKGAQVHKHNKHKDSYYKVNIKELLILFSFPHLFCYHFSEKKQVFKVSFRPGLTKLGALFYGW
jgi:hypothetical protein